LEQERFMAFRLKQPAYRTAVLRLGTVALLLSPVVASSQDSSAIAPGSRIRITQLEAGKSTRSSGTVVTAAADTVVLRLDGLGGTTTYSLAKISGLDVSRGRKGHIAVGVGVGFLAGAGTGALAGVLACNGCLSGSDELGALVPALGAAIGSVVGMLVGAGIGAHKTDTWEAVPSSGWRVSTVPTGGGRVAFGLSVPF
jgi:hypothetical protein